jgi:2',3'-cyclic-nucleotide 2'-phosphodiesterase (5'-nucleotidase family)
MVDGFAAGNHKQIGGLRGRENFINDIRKRTEGNNEAVLIVDAGNSLTSNVAIAKDFVAMGLDAMGLGELELLEGIAPLQKTIDEAHLPILNANVVATTNLNKTFFKPSLLIERNGVKFGIVGVTSPKYFSTHKAYLMDQGYQVIDPSKAATEQLDKLRQQGAETLIILSNMPWDEQFVFTDRLDLSKGPVAIIAGGDRRQTSIPAVQNGHLIVQTSGLGKFLGMLHMVLRPGAKKFYDGSNLAESKMIIAGMENRIAKDKELLPTFAPQIAELTQKIQQAEADLQSAERAQQMIIFNLIVTIEQINSR